MQQSKFDPCLFVGPNVMCIVYVDDLIFWSRDVANIDKVAMELCKLGVALEQEDDAAGSSESRWNVTATLGCSR